MSLPVAILAGGLATRLRPITETIPKALVDVAGKPFIVHQLGLLRGRRVVLCLGHLGEQVEQLIGDGRAYGVEVAYSYDGDTLLGTGGALQRALPLLGERFFVLYGDSYLRCDYAAIERAYLDSGKLGLMTVYRNDGRYDTSNVVFSGGHIVHYSKTQDAEMLHIDWGLGALHASVFAGRSGKYDLAAIYQDLIARGELVGYEVGERFYEIGSVSGLEDTRRLLETT